MAAVMDGYIRVSRVMGREGDAYISPKVQREAIQRWAEYKGIEVGEWLIDEDSSGGTHDRPALTKGIERALSGETTGIVSWKIDRFSRTTEGGLRDLHRLREADARLAFVVEDVDTGTTYGKLIYTILLAVSEAFLENVKTSWDEAKSRAVARGAFIGPTPFGYRRTEASTLEPDPATAPIVTGAFAAAATHGLRAALAHLIEHAPQRRWTTSKVRRILGSRSYLGETRSGDHVQTATHEPLTTKAAWEAAQSLPVSRAAADVFPLSGLLTCATCGQAMVGSRGGKGQRMYRCSGSLVQAKRRCHEGAVVTAERIEAYALSVAKSLVAQFDATVGDDEDLSGFELAEFEARAELEAFASDLTMRKVLGDSYHSHLLKRKQALDDAEEAYRSAAKAAHGHNKVAYTADDLESDPEVLRELLSSVYRITIRRGRGLKIEDRAGFLALDGDRSPTIPAS